MLQKWDLVCINMLKLIRLITRYFILDIQKAAELGPLITFVVNFNFK